MQSSIKLCVTGCDGGIRIRIARPGLSCLPQGRVLEQGGKFVQCVKHGTRMSGIEVGGMMPPLKPLNKDDKRSLEQVVNVLKTTIQNIQNGE